MGTAVTSEVFSVCYYVTVKNYKIVVSYETYSQSKSKTNHFCFLLRSQTSLLLYPGKRLSLLKYFLVNIKRPFHNN